MPRHPDIQIIREATFAGLDALRSRIQLEWSDKPLAVEAHGPEVNGIFEEALHDYLADKCCPSVLGYNQ
jgi:hypothetical protein